MFYKGFIYLILMAVMAFSISCGKNDEQKVIDAIESAHILLSTSQCQPAIDLLEGIGRQPKNAHYLKALSTAYACRAGYSTSTFFGSDVEKTASPAPLGGITTYSTSLETFTVPLTNDTKFADLRTAINLLLYAGGIPSTTEPASSERAKYFSSNQAADINTQLAFMMMVQTGRLFKVYANTSNAGVKGAGSGSNNCFTDYSAVTDDEVEGILALQEGACTVTNSPHVQLDSNLVSVPERRKRLCEGVVLLNGILELLPSILVSAGGGDLDDLDDVTDDLTAAKAALVSVYPAGEVLSVLSQSNCETSTGITEETLESYYATIFEALVE